MGNWTYKEKELLQLDDFPAEAVGFVYRVTNNTNKKFYIGKKILKNSLTKKLTNKEISEWSKPGRVPKKKKEIKESNWKDYHGSSKTVIEDVKLLGRENFTREILKMCSTKKQMSYWETYYQFKFEVLHGENSYNDQIAGKWYRKDVNPDGPLTAD